MGLVVVRIVGGGKERVQHAGFVAGGVGEHVDNKDGKGLVPGGVGRCTRRI